VPPVPSDEALQAQVLTEDLHNKPQDGQIYNRKDETFNKVTSSHKAKNIS